MARWWRARAARRPFVPPETAQTAQEAAPTAPSVIRPYFEALLLLLLAAGFFTLAGTGRLGGLVVLLGTAALGARAVLLALGIRPRLSNTGANLISALYLAFYPLDYFFLSRGFLQATVHLVLLVAVLKLFSATRPRDFAYLCVLAFLEVLAAATLTVGGGFLGDFTVFLVLTVATVISYEVFRAEASAPVRAELPAPKPAGGAGERRSAQELRGALVSVSLAAAASVALCGAGLFFLLPRFSFGYWQPGAEGQRLSGFSDDVQLGEIGRLQLSNQPVMHIRIQQSAPPAAPGSLYLYWTGRILTQFDGRDWYDPHHPRVARTTFGQLQFPTPPLGYAFPHRVIRYRVMLEPVGADVLFFAPQLREISTHLARVGVDATGTLSSMRGAFGEIAYTAISALGAPPPAELSGLGRAYPPRIQEEDLQLPPGLDPRIGTLARRIVGPHRDPYAQMRALTDYLRSHYRYTLHLRAGGSDPLADFLFRVRAGHCEYFASALAVMGRVLGIPTRVVNGFAGGEYNPVSGEYVLRGRDAHSWVEAYFPTRGPGAWVPFDATPAAAGVAGWSRFEQYADALSSFWQEWVINYDIFHQLSLARGVNRQVRQATSDWRRWFAWAGRHGWRRRADRAWAWLTQAIVRPSGKAGLLVLVLVIALGSALAAGWWTPGGSGRTPAAVASQATWYYRRLRRLLERSGFRAPPQCTPEELASALPAAGGRPAVKAAVGRFVGHYQDVRFGGDGATLPRLAEDLRAVEAALR
ncbi:MAG: transglutaminaseTgpA domain-containing protein [Terriglobales bacterium]